jgi:hypothetical protein
MPQSTARVETERASIYLQQLCKHFAHKIPVEFTPEAGRITFTAGTCRLVAASDALTMTAEAADAEALATVENVIERHLVRFAFRAPPTIVWRAEAGPT